MLFDLELQGLELVQKINIKFTNDDNRPISETQKPKEKESNNYDHTKESNRILQ